MWDRVLDILAGIDGATLIVLMLLPALLSVTLLEAIRRMWPRFGKLKNDLDDWHGEPARPGVPARPGAMEQIQQVHAEVTEVKTETQEVRAIVDAQAISQAAMTEAVQRIEAQVTPNHGSTDTLHQQLVDGLVRIKADQVEALTQIKADQETWWAHSAGERQRIRDEVGKQLAKQAAELKRIGRELAAHTHDE